MAFLEGKTDKEKKQMVAAAVLGIVALVALYFAFGRSLFSSGTTTATVKNTPSPKSTASPSAADNKFRLPTAEERAFNDQTTPLVPVVYQGGISAPDPGRNIFAFYEPPEKCKGDECPSPTPPPPSPIKSPTPTPTPPILIAGFNPQFVYAGARGFRLEVMGDKFTPDSRLYFNQTELATKFVSGQMMTADVPAKLIASEGSGTIIVQTTDGKLFSNTVNITIQAPPKPTVIYIGMIGRKRYNNDTAYLAENEKAMPFAARLNDVVGGRFRLIDISPAEVVFEDTSLGFKHRVPISKGILPGSAPPGRGTGPEPGVNTYPPGFIPQNVPGIPNNPQQQFNPNMNEDERRKIKEQMQKQDVDDEGDG